MALWALRRGRERRNLALPEADQPRRSYGPAFELLQQVSGLRPTAGSHGASDSGHDTGSEEESGEPQVNEVNAK